MAGDRDKIVSYESNKKIATIRINRAERLNALNEDVIQGLSQAWREFENGDDLVAILCSAGEKAFSVGADVKNPPKEMWEGVPSIGAKSSKPIIAAVQGWCVGGGMVMTCLLYTSPSPRDRTRSRMPSSA